MAAGDRERWDERWRGRPPDASHESSLIDLVTPWLPSSGRSLDLAGGGSGDAVHFAACGLDATVADLSDVGLDLSRELAADSGVSITTVQADLEQEPPPPGPWDLITVAYYLNRPLLAGLPELLAPQGVLAVVIATRHNLERNPRPPAQYLLEPGEIIELVTGLTVLHHSEAWRENGRHESWLVSRRD